MLLLQIMFRDKHQREFYCVKFSKSFPAIHIHVQALMCFYLSCLKTNISRQKRLTSTWKTTLISLPNQCRYMKCGINWSMLNSRCGKPWKGAFQNIAVYENIPYKWLYKRRMMKNNVNLCSWYWEQFIVELGGNWLLIWLQAVLGTALSGQSQAKHARLLS